jgi:type IV pilus assembly protein PilC
VLSIAVPHHLLQADPQDRSGPRRDVIDTLALWSPVFGKLVRKTIDRPVHADAGHADRAGVPILEAINITRDTSGNYVFEKALGKVHDSIREGESFADPLRESKSATPSSST